MATLKIEKKVSEALARAKNVGLVEEPVTIHECSLVLQSLQPDDYVQIEDETRELDNQAFLTGWRLGHLCRSIIEINGVSLRHIDFVEIEQEVNDPETGNPKVDSRTGRVLKEWVKLERHTYVRDHCLRTWSKASIDVLSVAFFNQVEPKSEKKAREGVNFVIPDETAEDTYRRLLSEAKEIEAHVPVELSSKILAEYGYLQKVSDEDLADAEGRLASLTQEPAMTENEEEGGPEPREAHPQASAPRRVSQPVPEVQEDQEEPEEPVRTPEEMMRARRPMNQGTGSVVQSKPLPFRQSQVQNSVTQAPAPAVQAASVPAPPGFQPGMNPGSTPVTQIPKKTAQYAREEGLDLKGTPLPDPNQVGSTSHIEMTGKQARRVASDAEPIFEQPPTAGINPRFRHQNRF